MAVTREAAQDATGYTLTGLNANTAYTLSLRWKSSGTGVSWSSDITVTTDVNNVPVFTDGASITIMRREEVGTTKVTASTPIGNPVSVNDDDDEDTITYTLKQNHSVFRIDTNSGQIQTRNPFNFNHEKTDSYTITVVATDSFIVSAAAEQEVVISITDDAVEQPSVYASVSLRSPGHTRTEITLQWDVDEYHDQFDEEDRAPILISYETGNTDAVTRETAQDATEYTITGLSANTAYTLSLRWKSSGSGIRWSSRIAVGANVNNIPVFAGGGRVTRSLTENVGTARATVNTPVGNPISATDADSDDTVTYTLKDDSTAFKIDNSGQILVRQRFNFNREQTAVYTVTVIASDDFNPPATAEQEVVINIANDSVEQPGVYTSTNLRSPGHTRTEITLQWDVDEYHDQFDEEDRASIMISYQTGDAAAVTREAGPGCNRIHPYRPECQHRLHPVAALEVVRHRNPLEHQDFSNH